MELTKKYSSCFMTHQSKNNLFLYTFKKFCFKYQQSSINLSVVSTRHNKIMSLFETIKPLIRICRLAGLTPFSMEWRTLNSSVFLRRLSNIFVVCIVIFMFVIILFNEVFISYKEYSPLQRVFLTLYMLLNHLHAVVALVEFYLKRQNQIDLFNRFEKFDFSLKQNLKMHIEYSKLKVTCWRFIFGWICGICAFAFPVILSAIQDKSEYLIYYTIYLLVFLPSSMVRKLSYVYSMMMVTLVHEYINLLNNYLKSVNKRNGYYICPTFSNQKNSLLKNEHSDHRKDYIDAEMLVFIKRSYCNIWESAQKIQNLMYFSIPIGLSTDMFVLILYSYWAFLCLFLPGWDQIAYYLLPIMNITMNLGYVVFLANNCNRAAESVSWNICEITK